MTINDEIAALDQIAWELTKQYPNHGTEMHASSDSDVMVQMRIERFFEIRAQLIKAYHAHNKPGEAKVLGKH